MLQNLFISNYAIIEELQVDFLTGMSAITGETGAGKSIIIGALNLILGERADGSTLMNKSKKCVIEGIFTGDRENLHTFLAANDLDILPEITVRREIAPNGKSRAFVNDTPVNLNQLSELGALLVDLHQQFDTRAVGEVDFQTNVLDALAGNKNALTEYKHQYHQWQQSEKKLAALQQQKDQFEKESDYNRFQLDELAEAAFTENEIENIDNALKTLTHAEDIKAALDRAYAELEENEQPLVPQLKSLGNLLNQYASYHKELTPVVERLRSAQIELQDIASELQSINNRIDYDAEKMEELSERLSLGFRLQKKHGVQSTSELLTIQQQLQEKLNAVLHINDDIAALEKQTATLFEKIEEQAEKVSQARKKQITPLEQKVNRLLHRVGMPNAAIKVSAGLKTAGITGKDNIEFLFDANKSGQYQPVSKVASGGELSRLMLCIKSLVAQSMDMPTLIFDEIDSGISGEAAKQVGVIMKALAEKRQVICITHQPQIAGKADAHFFVYKELTGDIVTTNIRKLGDDERITTIAQMLSGEKPTAAALENAKEMVQH